MEKRQYKASETVIDLRYNIAALAIAIIRDDVFIVEQAFDILEGKDSKLTNSDVEDMIAMKSQGMSYRQIGTIYGLTYSAVAKKITRYKEKAFQNSEGKVKNVV